MCVIHRVVEMEGVDWLSSNYIMVCGPADASAHIYDGTIDTSVKYQSTR